MVHALGGRIVLQLWHAGARETATPQAMTLTGIKSVISDYGTAAAQARRAGFDGVEIAANGTYLIAQFLNRRLNRRADEFGAPGHRLVHEIVGAVAAAWDGRRAGVRLSPYWGAADRSAAGQPRGAYPYAPDEETLAGYDTLVAGLSGHPVAYLHLRGRAPAAPGARPGFRRDRPVPRAVRRIPDRQSRLRPGHRPRHRRGGTRRRRVVREAVYRQPGSRQPLRARS